MNSERGLRREMVGKVISDKMQKTVVVETRKHVTHPKYHKVMVRRAKFAAHDEKGIAHLGDTVRLRESRPLSKTKRWVVLEVIEKAKMRPEDISTLRKSRAVKGPQAEGETQKGAVT